MEINVPDERYPGHTVSSEAVRILTKRELRTVERASSFPMLEVAVLRGEFTDNTANRNYSKTDHTGVHFK